MPPRAHAKGVLLLVDALMDQITFCSRVPSEAHAVPSEPRKSCDRTTNKKPPAIAVRVEREERQMIAVERPRKSRAQLPPVADATDP